MKYNKQNKESGSSIVNGIIIFIVLIVVICLYFFGNIPYFSANYYNENKVIKEKEPDKWKYEREPVYESKLSSSAYYVPVEIKLVSESDSSIVVSAGTKSNQKQYTIIADSEYIKVKDDKFRLKTNDTFVKVEGTKYYLYAYIENGDKYIGLAK